MAEQGGIQHGVNGSCWRLSAQAAETQEGVNDPEAQVKQRLVQGGAAGGAASTEVCRRDRVAQRSGRG